jgi:hypothetical protein
MSSGKGEKRGNIGGRVRLEILSIVPPKETSQFPDRIGHRRNTTALTLGPVLPFSLKCLAFLPRLLTQVGRI